MNKVYVVVVSEYNLINDNWSREVEPYAWPDRESAEIHKEDVERSLEHHDGLYQAEIVELQIMPPIRKPF